MKYLGYFLCVIVLLSSCEFSKKDKSIAEAEEISVDVNIKRLEHEFFNAKSPEEIGSLLHKYPYIAKGYFKLQDFQNIDDAFIKGTYSHFSNKDLFGFYQYTVDEYGDFSDIKSQLERLFRYIKFYYPDYVIPEINTMVTGFSFDKDIFFSDKHIVVGIDYFLGEDAPFRPQFYNYLLERYKKPFLVPMVSMGISEKFNNADLNDETLLAYMIYYGKTHYFMERVLPNLPDSLNIMYTGEQLKTIEENTDLIWAHFVNNKLLFDSSPRVREKYVNEAPKINEIGEKCPGRIGRWLGWQIVRKYMESNPQVTLQELMADTDAQKIFKQSRYKPKNK
ncbi:MAG: gliding motility lipoprotein GldB [Cytophagaceae bacterium]